MGKKTVVKINLDSFLDWKYQDKDDFSLKDVVRFEKEGLLPINKRIKNSKDFFVETGFLPTVFVENVEDLKGRKDVNFDEDEPDEINGGNFNIEWV
jgi:hypothetical protein